MLHDERAMGDSKDGSAGAGDSPGRQTKANTPTDDPSARPGLLARLFGRVPAPPPGAAGGAATVNGHSLTPAGGLGNLNRVRVEDVAIPRAEIVAVPVDIPLPKLVETFRDSGLTRLPVFRETLDTPLGFIHLKDLALKHGFSCDDTAFDLEGMLRPLLFAPPSMPIGVLLQKMQTDRIHMALVIDEYGGVDGLVTIEDLIEQVVGEIADEHDIEEDRSFVRERPGVYLCQARTPLDEFEAETGLKLRKDDDEDEIDTLGGLVFVMAGRVPVRGEVIHHDSGVEFEVLDADPRRVKRLRVVVPERLRRKAAAEN